MRIAVAMSGGVDSSVAAHILATSGHDVFGLTMRIWPCGGDAEFDPRVCCGPAAVRDAERVAGDLGIRHYVVDMRRRFDDEIAAHFAAEYARGRTPNPCVRCNEIFKFGSLLSKAVSLGAERLATGHHAIIRRNQSGSGYILARAKDTSKDQSYFLYRMTQDQLSVVLMPVGSLTKESVRAAAGEAGLHVADRPESQDVCFVPAGDVATFLEERAPGALRPGPIVDLSGNRLGEHRGIGLYTVGQRTGLGLSLPRPAYVVRIDASTNTIVVGDDDELFASELVASDLTWIAGSPPEDVFRASAKVRYKATPAACTVTLSEGEARVNFDEPQRAVAPGQAVVFYDGDAVLGGGTIDA